MGFQSLQFLLLVLGIGLPLQVLGRGDAKYDYVFLSFWKEDGDAPDDFYKDTRGPPDVLLPPGTEAVFRCGTDRVLEANGDLLEWHWSLNGTNANETGTVNEYKIEISTGVFVYESSFTFTPTSFDNDTILSCAVTSPEVSMTIVDEADTLRIIIACPEEGTDLCPSGERCYTPCDGIFDCLDNSDEMGCPIEGLNSTVYKQWYGGFVGNIHIPITAATSSWMITMEFPRKIFNLDVGDAVILDREKKRKVYHLGNTACNGAKQVGEYLDIMFLADNFDKFRGIVAEVTFAYEPEEEGSMPSMSNRTMMEF